ncbi:uncharacterized protein LOC123549675 [Mercenaria mercenaria]|uniref:uncharacterized protein LOC123549675 n=1 Tax=Mercenaria mercenaria TaxID=6596 RepID=UPI00234F2014|nr:uncharacterized protein LOC123549675 [Mercenaria mercenaria]
MSSSVSTNVYECPSWEVYPRIYYFYRRYTDLLTRYKRVTGLLPKCLHDDRIVSQLDKIRDYFDSGVRLNVIGKEVGLKDLVFSIPDKSVSRGSPRVVVFICHTDIRTLDLEGLEDINALLHTLTEDFPADSRKENVIYISCGIEKSFSDKEIEDFKSVVTDIAKRLAIRHENILIGPEKSCLKTKISDELEKIIMAGFQKISAYLQSFDLDDKESSSEKDNILETDVVVNAIRDFLRNPYTNSEINFMIHEEKDGERFLEEVIKHLCRAIKSAAVNQLAKKHKLRPGICNAFLHEIQFEEALSLSVSKSTRHHLRKLNDTNKRYSFDFLLYPLQSDMKPVFEMTDGKLSAMRRLSMTIRRLIFEINGYLKQSTVISENQIDSEDVPVKVPENLRRDILKIKGVYGLGTVYGNLEIHLDEKEKEAIVDTEKTSNANTLCDGAKRTNVSDQHSEEMEIEADDSENQQKDRIQENDITDVKSKIAVQLRNHNFHFPYSIRYIRSKAKEMNGSFEPGDTLHCQTKQRGTFTKGTLGTFLNSTDGTLYGLTCAHVVDGTVRVFVQKGGYNPLSISQHVVKSGHDECRLIDIAALKVIHTLQESSKSSLENNVWRVTKANLEQNSPVNLVGRYVHKFGAETGLTQGIIMTVDYSKYGPKAEDYIVIIDPLAANNLKDLEDMVGSFCESLLVSLPQDGTRQQNEDSDANMEAPVVPSNETSEEGAEAEAEACASDKKVECIKSRKRKFENEDTATQLESTLNAEASCAHINNENQGIADADKVMVAGNRILCSRNTNTDVDTTSDIYMRCPQDTQECTNVKLYVRYMNESDLDQYRNDAVNVFAKAGDSGSAICTQNLSPQSPTYSAIAMLSAGDLDIEGHSGKKALSFMFKDGLKKLHEHCQIEF